MPLISPLSEKSPKFLPEATQPDETLLALNIDPSYNKKGTLVGKKYSKKQSVHDKEAEITASEANKTEPKEEPASETLPSSPIHQPEEQTNESAQVDEQLFQDVLAISLERERVLEKSSTKNKTSTKKTKDSKKISDSDTKTIIGEFQLIVENMFPSAEMERIACAKKTRKNKLGKTVKSGKKLENSKKEKKRKR